MNIHKFFTKIDFLNEIFYFHFEELQFFDTIFEFFKQNLFFLIKIFEISQSLDEFLCTNIEKTELKFQKTQLESLFDENRSQENLENSKI